jgi:hypothetical protein
MFIGPTSQAPRVDEARDDTLYELGIAFGEMARRATAGPPAAVARRPTAAQPARRRDRQHASRRVLHRQALFARWADGRLGLLEFRAFEMPPHCADERSLQMLLLRALVARFWKTPYEGRLVRWGTSLHDRFMLPHFVAQDILDVLADLRAPAGPSRSSGSRRSSSSASRASAGGRAGHRGRTAAGAGAVARARRGDPIGGDDALRRFVGGALQVKVKPLHGRRFVLPATAARCR